MKSEQKFTIRIKGHLNDDWRQHLNALSLTRQLANEKSPVTTLTVLIKDQSELYGFISTLRNLGLSLLYLNQTETEKSDGKNY